MASTIRTAADAISARWPHAPRAALVLGSGLGQLARQIEIELAVPYREIPGFPRSTALGHAGRLVCGKLAGIKVAALDGRSHLYEGYTREQVALPVRALAALGASVLVVSNASGGLNAKIRGGDILVIEDHLDLMFGRAGAAPLAGRASVNPRVSRCPAVSFYDRSLRDAALAVARRDRFAAYPGVYAALVGPNYETRAEYRMLRRIGADVVGMSTAPEVAAAAESGLRVLGLSVVTNVARPDAPRQTSAAEVVSIAEQAEPKLRAIVLGVLANPEHASG